MASDGAFCDSCGVCADSPQCIKKANKKLPCKVITTNATSHKHHWVKGGENESAVSDLHFFLIYLLISNIFPRRIGIFSPLFSFLVDYVFHVLDIYMPFFCEV